jgi:hypothetical protein
MKYQNKSFSSPVCTSKITEIEFEIAVGVRCPLCKKRMEECKGHAKNNK